MKFEVEAKGKLLKHLMCYYIIINLLLVSLHHSDTVLWTD